MSVRLWLAVAFAVVSFAALRAQNAPGHVENADHFSPLQFDALREYEQAYPAEPGSAAVIRAAAGKYWYYNGLVYQGSTPQGAPWVSLGPLTLQNAGSAITTSGRVSTIAISPRCRATGACTVWVGTAGGGVWRTDDAMTRDDPKWRWVGTGPRHQQHRQPRARSQRRHGQHDLRRHRRDEHAEQFRRRHRPLSLDRRRRSLDAHSDDDHRPRRVGVADRLHVPRAASARVVDRSRSIRRRSTSRRRPRCSA